MQAGATVCVPRPYRILELVALVRSLRQTGPALPPVECDAVRLEPESHRVFVRDQVMALPLPEFHLLHLLMTHHDRVLIRDQIREHLWPGLPRERSNTLNVHIRRRRQRLGDDAWHPAIITTVCGMGYRFTAADTDAARRPSRDEPSRHLNAHGLLPIQE